MTALRFERKDTYVVKAGQTIWEIAAMHGVPPGMLIAANRLDALSPGRILTIPAFEGELYTVQAGDSEASLGLDRADLEKNGVRGIYPTLVIARIRKA